MMSPSDADIQEHVEVEAELSPEEFGRLIDQYNNQKLAEGEVVRGRILKILENEVIVDIGYKSEGTISISEFRGPGGVVMAGVGDTVKCLSRRPRQ